MEFILIKVSSVTAHLSSWTHYITATYSIAIWENLRKELHQVCKRATHIQAISYSKMFTCRNQCTDILHILRLISPTLTTLPWWWNWQFLSGLLLVAEYQTTMKSVQTKKPDLTKMTFHTWAPTAHAVTFLQFNYIDGPHKLIWNENHKSCCWENSHSVLWDSSEGPLFLELKYSVIGHWCMMDKLSITKYE